MSTKPTCPDCYHLWQSHLEDGCIERVTVEVYTRSGAASVCGCVNKRGCEVSNETAEEFAQWLKPCIHGRKHWVDLGEQPLPRGTDASNA